MSRVGRVPITVPAGVSVELAPGEVTVRGSGGTLQQQVHPDLRIVIEEGEVRVERPNDSRQFRSLHGLTRTLIANMVTGVSEGFTRSLELVGYRVLQTGTGITLQVGYSHTVEVQPMEGVSLEVEGNNRIHVRGADKQVVGEMAARIRRVRRPDAYKGKGVRYLGEVLRLKPGKSAARG
jgi:large subunit ribosomal protein L6